METRKDELGSTDAQVVIDNETLIIGLDTLMPSERQKKIVEYLQHNGIKLSLGGFKAMLEAERERRKQIGDVAICDHCGQPLEGARSEIDVSESGESPGASTQYGSASLHRREQSSLATAFVGSRHDSDAF
jgi:hypothetical protein